jgi:hypothetical protein
MRRARLLPALITVLAVRPAASQLQFSADIGASRLRRADVPQSGALTFGANAIAAGENGWFRSSILGVQANEQQSTAQGMLAGSFGQSTDRLVRAEIGGSLSGFGESGYSLTLSGEVTPRLQVGRPSLGAGLGIGVGKTRHERMSATFTRPVGDAWLVLGDEQFASSLSFVKTSASFVGTDLERDAPSYHDLNASWRHDRGGLSLGATGGYRYGTRHVSGGTWGSADAALWVFPRTSLVLSVGRSLDDAVRGVPRTTFTSIALRVTGTAHETIARRSVRGARLTIERVDERRRRFEIRGVRGARVELMGDFTDWSPVALDAVGDVWRVERAVSPGLHRIALRVDGGEWIAPVNVPHAKDDLGGVVGLITVP